MSFLNSLEYILKIKKSLFFVISTNDGDVFVIFFYFNILCTIRDDLKTWIAATLFYIKTYMFCLTHNQKGDFMYMIVIVFVWYSLVYCFSYYFVYSYFLLFSFVNVVYMINIIYISNIMLRTFCPDIFR